MGQVVERCKKYKNEFIKIVEEGTFTVDVLDGHVKAYINALLGNLNR